MREIWDLQLKLPKRQGKQAWRLLNEPRFRAAYDFLLLRETAGEATEGLAAWWTEFQREDEAAQQLRVSKLGKPKRSKGRRRQRKTPRNSSE